MVMMAHQTLAVALVEFEMYILALRSTTLVQVMVVQVSLL
jgi:hypothetical protein